MLLYPELPQGALTSAFGDFGNPQQGAFRSTGPSPLDPRAQTATRAPFQKPTRSTEEPTEQDRPGFFGRIMQQPGGSRALIALGSSLLSSQNFFEGLGQGAMAYQGVLDEESAALQPQLIDDGRFQTVRGRDGQITLTQTEAGNFAERQAQSRLASAQAIASLRDKGDTLRHETTMGFRDRWEDQDNTTANRGLDLRESQNERDNETDLEIARINSENAWRIAQARVGNQNDRPPPAAIQRQIGDYTTTRDAQTNAANAIDPVIRAIESGDLSFSLPSNLRHRAAIATGIGGNEETVWFSQYQTSLESLRNALLIANKGVQTDGDAERAMAELIAGSGNTETVLANLRRVYASLGVRAEQANARIDELARQYGADVESSSPGAGAPPTQRSTGSSGGVRWRVVGQ